MALPPLLPPCPPPQPQRPATHMLQCLERCGEQRPAVWEFPDCRTRLLARPGELDSKSLNKSTLVISTTPHGLVQMFAG